MEAKKVMFIVNPRAGRGRGERNLKEIIAFQEGLAKEKGIEVMIKTTVRDGAGNTFNLAKEGAETGCQYLVVIGGDGTVNEAVNGIVSSGISPEYLPVIGIIRAGNGNDVANSLRIRGKVKEIIKTLAQDESLIQDKVAIIDLAKVNWEEESRIFVNIFSLGLCARITKVALGFKEKFQRFSFLPLFGEGMYISAALLELFFCLRLRYPEVEIRSSYSPTRKIKATLIALANGSKYGGMFKIAPQAQMDDGLLDICRVEKIGRLRLLLNIPRLCLGTHLSLTEVETTSDGRLPQVFSLTISSLENLPCQIDGEVLPAGKEYHISILPKSLKVLVS